jgi:ORF6N domain
MAPAIPILTILDQRVILDADLARLYGVATRALNQAVKRNTERFPRDFIFQLNQSEKMEVITNCDHLRGLRFSKSFPFAFTEHGALMAANVLTSPEAITMSVYVIRAFVKIREELVANTAILKRLAEIDKMLLVQDSALRDVYEKLLPLLTPEPDKPKPSIGF